MIFRSNGGVTTDITNNSAMDFTSPSSDTRNKDCKDNKTHRHQLLLLLCSHGCVLGSKRPLSLGSQFLRHIYTQSGKGVCYSHDSALLTLTTGPAVPTVTGPYSSFRFVWLVSVGSVEGLTKFCFHPNTTYM